jgi:hypothetical protein
MEIKFYLKAVETVGKPDPRVKEFYTCLTGRKVGPNKANPEVIEGEVDADIRHEHANLYNEWHAKVEVQAEKLYALARSKIGQAVTLEDIKE